MKGESWRDKGYDAFMNKGPDIPRRKYKKDASELPAVLAGGGWKGDFVMQDGTLKSSNYASGSAGWIIKADGSAEFQTVTVSGYFDKSVDDLDDVSDGTNYGKVASTDISAGHITVVDSQASININDTTFGNQGVQLQYNAGTPRVYIGDGSNQYFNFDGTNITWKAANAELDGSGNLTVTGGVVQWGTISGTTNAPADNADVTGNNTANDTTNVNSVVSTQVQPRAETLFERFVFIGNKNDGMNENLGANDTLTRYFFRTWMESYEGSTVSLESDVDNMIDWDDGIEFVLFAFVSETTSQDVFLGLKVGSAGSVPADATSTAKHIGFFIQDGTLYASNANGTTQNKTDISTGITLTNWNQYRVVFDSGTDIKFYVNDNLEATHTNNLPSSTGNPILSMGIESQAATGGLRHLTIANNYLIVPDKP